MRQRRPFSAHIKDDRIYNRLKQRKNQKKNSMIFQFHIYADAINLGKNHAYTTDFLDLLVWQHKRKH